MKTIQTEIEASLEKTEDTINKKIEKALENPLAGMATSK